MAVKKVSFLSILLVIVAISAMVLATIWVGPFVTDLIRDPDKFKNYLADFGGMSILVFIGLQMLQVIIAAIPGEFIQIAGGFVFGTFLGTVYSVVGILLGAILAFFIARLLGIAAINKFFSKATLDRFKFLTENKKSEAVIFLLFLIPGLPKDILVYIAGLSPIKPLRFFTIYLIARMPGLIGSSLIGANIQQKNYFVAIMIFVLSCLLFLVGFFWKDAIMRWIRRDKGY